MSMLDRTKIVTLRDGRTLTRSLFLKTAVGEPSERLVVLTVSFGSWLENDSAPLYFESATFETDESQEPRKFVRVVERYRIASDAVDGHNRWCQLLSEPRRPALHNEDSE